ncbi:PRC-barrel domain-containing protein [Desertibaculum subflavum]|uniref:PRC-barrel domain-containing protein n=1 Tax=Desertibaculum subflavum TaxID=2268458 RepID=UPI0013C3F56B
MAQRASAFLLAAALLGATGAASAQRDTGQQAPPPARDAAPAGNYQDPPVSSRIDNTAGYLGREFITSRSARIWRATDLIGRDAVTREGEEVGEVRNLLIDPDRRVLALVIEFGGTLGIGEERVAVPMRDVSVLGAAPHARSGDLQGTADIDPGAATTTSPRTEPMVNDRGTDDVPLKVVINLTREQLEQAPRFEGDPIPRNWPPKD